MSGITIAQIVIDDSSDKTITGVWVFDRSLGGTLAIPALSSFPSPTTAGEIIWRTDLNRIYRRNDSNTGWDAVVADFSAPGQVEGSILYFDGSSWVQLPPSTDGYVLTTHGAGNPPSWGAVSGSGLGDVVGPGSSTDNAIARFDGATGKLIQNSTVTLSDTGGLSGVDEIVLNQRAGSSVPYSEGKIFYDQDEHTLTVYNDVNGVSLNLGQELYIRVSNTSGSTITNGSVVYINGAQGNRPTVGLASAAIVSTDNVIGLAAHDINNNTIGYIATYGLIHDINTNAYAEGTVLYVSSTSGQWTNVKPTGTNYVIQIGSVTRQHPTQGIILVNVKTTGHLEDLHDVRDGYPYDGYYLKGDGSFWTGSSLSADILNILPAGGAPVNVTKSAALAGVASTWSRSDHKHDITTASASSLTGTSANTEGAAISLARSDHTHSIVGLLTSTAPSQITVTTASAGVSTSAAREDHVHSVSTVAPTGLTVGGSNIAGTATSLSRSDHVHSLPAFGSSAGTFCEGNDIRLSNSRNPLAHAASHQDGGADEIVVTGLSGLLADAQKTTIRKNSGSDIGARPRLNFIEGSNITLTIVDDAGSSEVDITISSTGGGGGGGSQTLAQVLALGNSADGYDINLNSGSSLTSTTGNVTVDDNLDVFGDGYVSGTFEASNLRYPLVDGADGYVVTTDGYGNLNLEEIPKRIVVVEYVMAEDVNNTTKYFYTWKSSSSLADVERSGANAGIQNANNCSPYQVPFDGKIVKAVLTIKGVGVQNGSVTYPVSFQTDLFDIGFTAESKHADIDFSISNSYTVGAFSVGNTNFKGSTSLNITVTEGQMLGLKFINGTGASTAGQMRNAFVSLIIEES